MDESVGLTASFENRTTMQARKLGPVKMDSLERLADIVKADQEILLYTTPLYTTVVGTTLKRLYLYSCSRQGLNPIQVQLEKICQILAKKA